MLDFFLNYPAGHYLKAMTLPNNPPKIGFFLSRDRNQIMVKKGKTTSFWHGSLSEMQGSPNLEIFDNESPDSKVPTVYKKEVYKELGLNKYNPVSIVVDHPEIYLAGYTVTSFETADDLLNALKHETSSVITNWKSFGNQTEYIWEILSWEMNTLRGPEKLPKKVILCGFPEEKAENAAKWAEVHKQELCNIVPVAIQLLRWVPTVEDAPNFFLAAQTGHEVIMAQYENKSLKSVLLLRSKDGITAEEVNDLNEMVEEGDGRNSILLCWGVLPGSPVHTRLAGRYPNLRMLTPELLRDIQPIEQADGVEKFQTPEAWLVNHLLR